MGQLLRYVGGTAIVLGTLLGGYVTAVQALGFPGSPVSNSLDGTPPAVEGNGNTPAVGADTFDTVPLGARWEILYYSAKLTTSAAVANRRPSLTLYHPFVTSASYFPVGQDQPANN